MKKNTRILLITSLYFSPLLWRGAGGEAFSQYASQNITLLSHWDNTSTVSEPIYNIRYNSVWGWVDSQDNKEYAIIGSTDGTYFIDVTNPASPVVKDYVAGRRDSCIWREYKTYMNYLYVVSDDGAPNSTQIIDLTPLPDSVHVVYDTDTLIRRAHTVFIDGDKMYCGSVFMPNHGGHSNMGIYSLANPTAPTFLRRLETDYPGNDNVHDMFVRNDTCYASSSYSGLFIYKLNTNNTLSQLASFSGYEPGGAYNHSTALTNNGKTVIFADEVPANKNLKSLDVSDFSNLAIADTFRSYTGTTATPHNIFIPPNSNSRVVVAYYQDGIQIFDISNPANVTRTGFFDCAPTNCPTCPNPNYSGCWGAYIDLPSGIILASDMQDGLFVLDPGSAMGIDPIPVTENSVTVFPNPFPNDIYINFSLIEGEKVSFTLTDISGKRVMQSQLDLPNGKTTLTLEGKNLASGAYLLDISSKDVSLTKKIIKTNK